MAKERRLAGTSSGVSLDMFASWSAAVDGCQRLSTKVPSTTPGRGGERFAGGVGQDGILLCHVAVVEETVLGERRLVALGWLWVAQLGPCPTTSFQGRNSQGGCSDRIGRRGQTGSEGTAWRGEPLESWKER